jgi:protein phosphatase
LDVVQGELQPGDTFVICSDGLTGHVSNNEILELAVAGSARLASEALVQLALDRGGKDNVSVIVLRVAQGSQKTVIQRATEER